MVHTGIIEIIVKPELDEFYCFSDKFKFMGCKFLVDKTGRYDAPEIPTTLTIPSSIPFNYNILISKINNQYLNLINIIGSGQNKSFIIIDFLTKKNSFAFQYNWNYQVIETSETIIQNLEPEPEPIN